MTAKFAAPVDAVYVGQGHDVSASQEFSYGWQMLSRLWSPTCTVELTRATSMDDLANAALGDISRQRSLKPSLILLLRHAHLVLTEATLNSLYSALEAGAPAACSWDTEQPPAAIAPDYCTLGGLYRYQRKLKEFPLGPGSDSGAPAVMPLHEPLAVLVRPDCLPGFVGKWELAVRPVDAFVHPFANYRDNSRVEASHLVPANARRILDVGGGSGGFLAHLKAERMKAGISVETHLAEADQESCRLAQVRVDTVWPGDFLSQPISSGFDCVSFLDVLEHTEDPVRWLRRAKDLLAPEGCVVASIPNVGHWSVIADLLEGRWDYAPVGIHCITHLRFYTLSGLESLFFDAGLKITHIEATTLPRPPWMTSLAAVPGLTIDQDSLDAYNWLVRARPC